MKEYLHGGDLDIALKKYGGHLNDWLDLSTGINRISYPWKFKNDILKHWEKLSPNNHIKFIDVIDKK